jgi:hypothetical protein
VQRFGPPSLISQWIVSGLGASDLYVFPDGNSKLVVDPSGDGGFYAYPDGNVTIIQRATTGDKYIIRNGGRRATVSPDGHRLLWQEIDRRGEFDTRRSRVWVANVDGSDARTVGETIGIHPSAWIDGQRVLVVGAPLEKPPGVSIAALSLGATPSHDRLQVLAQVSSPREAVVSPEGNWLVYSLAFQRDPGDDGLWLVPTDGSQPSRKLSFFGGFQWRDDTHLLYIPMELGAESHTLWEYDVLRDATRRLTDPTQTKFKVAQNDWTVSRNGRYVAFVNAADHNLWLIDLFPEASD